MVETRLVHFSTKPVTSVYSVAQENSPRLTAHFEKPRGLWVSVEGNGDGWSDWCAGETFELGSIVHAVTLAPDANVLTISTPFALDDFAAEFGKCPDEYPFQDEPTIMWGDVASRYKGILIAPYQWSRRLHRGSSWYYGWDCASGCIWDASAIASIEQVRVAA